MKKIIGSGRLANGFANISRVIISGAIALSSAAVPAQALGEPYHTKPIAQMKCIEQGFMLMYPEYYGKTRGGLDIWICVETGSSRDSFVMMHPGPYPVLLCNLMQCKVVDETY